MISRQEGWTTMIGQSLTVKKEVYSIALNLIASSDILVTQLGEHVDKNSEPNAITDYAWLVLQPLSIAV